MNDFNATQEEVVMVLTHFYPGMIFTLYGIDYDLLIVHPESPVPKPSKDDIESHIPEAKQLILAERAKQAKISAFQSQYPIQDQIVNLITAIYDPATTNIATLRANPTLNTMKNAWVNA